MLSDQEELQFEPTGTACETKYKPVIFNKTLQTQNHSKEGNRHRCKSIKRKSVRQGTKLQQESINKRLTLQGVSNERET